MCQTALPFGASTSATLATGTLSSRPQRSLIQPLSGVHESPKLHQHFSVQSKILGLVAIDCERPAPALPAVTVRSEVMSVGRLTDRFGLSLNGLLSPARLAPTIDRSQELLRKRPTLRVFATSKRLSRATSAAANQGGCEPPQPPTVDSPKPAIS